jgi:hypothetical protein
VPTYFDISKPVVRDLLRLRTFLAFSFEKIRVAKNKFLTVIVTRMRFDILVQRHCCYSNDLWIL